MSQQSLYLASVFCLSFVCLFPPRGKKKKKRHKDKKKRENLAQHRLPLTLSLGGGWRQGYSLLYAGRGGGALVPQRYFQPPFFSPSEF